MKKGKIVLGALLWIFLIALASTSNAMISVKYEDFTLTSSGGETHQLSQYQGQSSVLLVFFATWCPPCIREVPDLIKLQDKYGDKGLKILAVDIDEPRNLVEGFIKNKGINYTVLLDQGARVAEIYDVRAIPMNILIDKKGEVKYVGHALPKNIEDVL